MKGRSFLAVVAALAFSPLSIPAQVLFWDPDGATVGTSVSGVWDTVTSNWTAVVDSGVSNAWVQGNDATFNIAANYTVTVAEPITVGNISVAGSAGTLTIANNAPNGLTLATSATLNTGGRNVTISAPISGAFSLTRLGAGTVTLSGASTYSGGTTLSAGTTTVGVDSLFSGGVLTSGPFGTGPVSNTAAVTISASGPRTVGNPMSLGANLTIAGSIALTFTNGDFMLSGGNRTITVNNSADTILACNLADDGTARTFTKAGTGRLIMKPIGVSSFLGGITASAGTLVAGHEVPFPTNANNQITINASTLDLNGFDVRLSRLGGNAAGSVLLGTNTLTAGNNASSAEFSGVISGTGRYVKVGTISEVLSGTNTFSGGITIAEGALYLPTNGLTGSPISLGAGPNLITITGTGRIGANRSSPSIAIVTNNIVLNTLTAGFDPANGGDFYLTGQASGSGGFLRYSQGSGFPALAGDNVFSGGVFIDSRALGIGHKHALGTGMLTLGNPTNPPSNAVEISSTQDLLGANAVTNPVSVNQNFTISGTRPGTGFGLELSGPITLTNRTNSITVTGPGLTLLSGVISSEGGINKDGANTLVLSGNNTYLGSTIITTGTLALTNSGSLAGSSNITLVGGTLDASGRTDGTLTVGSAQVLNGDGLLSVLGKLTNHGVIELKAFKAGSVSSDSLQGPTQITYGGTLRVVLSGDPLAGGDSMKLFDAASYFGSFAGIVPVTPGNGLSWDTSTLTSDGTLRVKAAPTINATLVVGNNFVMSGTGGTAGGTYSVLSSTNIATLLANWPVVQNGSFDGSGNFTVTNAITPGELQRFFLLRTP